jgi:Transglycosylase SLT domain
MAREIPQYVSQLAMGSMPQVQFTNAPSQTLSSMASLAGSIGAEMQEEQRRTEKMQYDILINKTVNEYERESGSDVELFKSKLDGFQKGLAKDAPGYLKQDIELRLQTVSAPAFEKMYNTQKEIQKDQDKLFRLDKIRQAETSIKNNISVMRNGTPEQKLSSGRAVQLALQDIQDGYLTPGPDGKLVFSPEQAFKDVESAKDYVVTEDAKAWFKAQPNKLAALEEWREGRVNLTLPNVDGVSSLESVGKDQLFASLIQQESGGRQTDATGAPLSSEKGAIGIAQVMPETAPEAAKLAGVAFDELKYKTDPEYNKKLGRAYFDKQIAEFGSPTLALMAYNAGPGAVSDFMDGTNKTGKNPNKLKIGDPNKGEVAVDEFVQRFPFKETRDYVNSIAANTGLAVINSRQVLSADATEKIDRDIVSQYKEDLAFEEAIRAKQERRDKELADFQFTEHQQRLQDRDNPLTLEELDMYDGVYRVGGKSKEYLAMRAELISGEPEVEDGATRNHLLDMSTRGQDISEVGLQAVKEGRIKMTTYNQINELRQATQGPAADTLAFNLKQLETSLAKLNAAGVVENGAVLSNAKAALVNEHNKFIEKNGRQPSFKESDEMRRVIQANSSMVGSDYTIISDKPDYVPASVIMDDNVPYKDITVMVFKKYDEKYKEQAAAASQLLGGMGEQSIKKYLMQQDPEFIRDSLWLQKVKSFRSPTTTIESPK